MPTWQVQEISYAYLANARGTLHLISSCKLLPLFEKVIFLVLRLPPYTLQILAKYFMLWINIHYSAP